METTNETKTNPNTLFLSTKDPNGSMLDLISATNLRYSVPKHLILNSRFFPGDRVSVKIGGETLHIEGKNLLPIYRLIGSHKILAIKEGSPVHDNEDDFQTWVDSIVITKPVYGGGVETVFPE